MGKKSFLFFFTFSPMCIIATVPSTRCIIMPNLVRTLRNLNTDDLGVDTIPIFLLKIFVMSRNIIIFVHVLSSQIRVLVRIEAKLSGDPSTRFHFKGCIL